jgi:hypothetical protein
MKTQTPMKLAALIIFQFITITMLFAQAPLKQTQPENSDVHFPEASAYTNANLTYNIIDAPNNTYCYDVYAEGRLMIHQTSAPGLPGNEGFKTKDDAAKVAEMVMYKIRKGEMPPTVTLEEMKELGIIK